MNHYNMKDRTEEERQKSFRNHVFIFFAIVFSFSLLMLWPVGIYVNSTTMPMWAKMSVVAVPLLIFGPISVLTFFAIGTKRSIFPQSWADRGWLRPFEQNND